MNTKRKIINNSFNMIIALICRKLFTFLYILLMARYSNVYTTGLFFYSMAIIGVFGLVMDIGLSPVFIRESARDIKKLPNFLGNIIGIKIIMCPIAVIVACSIVWIIDYPQVTKQLLYIVILIMVLDSLSMTCFGCFRAKQILKYEARSMVIGHSVMLVLGTFFLIKGFGIQYLMFAVLSSTIFNFIYSIWLVYTKLNIVPSILYEWKIIKKIMYEAFPFLVGSLFMIRIVDIIVLSYFSDLGSVALFGVPASVVRGLQLIPIALIAALYPEMSYLKNKSKEKLINTFHHSVYSLFMVGAPIAIGLSVLASDFLILVYGVKFLGSALPLQILSISLIPIFFNYLIGSLLNASDKQTTNTVIKGISVSSHILMCFILIPLYDVVGAAVVGLMSNTLLFALGTYFAIKVLKRELKVFLPDLARIALASILMGTCVFFLKTYIHILVIIPIGMIIYIMSLIVIEKLTLESGIRSKALKSFEDFYNIFLVKN